MYVVQNLKKELDAYKDWERPGVISNLGKDLNSIKKNESNTWILVRKK
jgi:hypothetical protein